MSDLPTVAELRAAMRDKATHLQSDLTAAKARVSMLEDENNEIWDRYTAAKVENEALRNKADHCEREARQWRQEARTQSSIVAEIYQELTGKTGEPGDWNGARPLRAAMLRNQAEAVDRAAMNFGGRDYAEVRLGLSEWAQSLRTQAEAAEKGGDDD